MTVTDILVVTVSLLGLWYLVFFLYREYRVDLFRHEMRKLQGALEARADAGLIHKKHEAYELVTSLMSGYANFANQVGWVQVMLANSSSIANDVEKLRRVSFDQRWESAVKDLDVGTRDQLDGVLRDVHERVFKHVVFGSPVLALTIVVPLMTAVFFAVVGKFVGKRIRQIVAGWLQRGLAAIDEVATEVAAAAMSDDSSHKIHLQTPELSI